MRVLSGHTPQVLDFAALLWGPQSGHPYYFTMKLRKGDNVKMMNGKDRGKTGKVLAVLAEGNKLVVEGLNTIKKHTRARKQGQKGQIITKERAVSASSVALVCKSCGLPTRIGYKLEKDGKIRICKKCKSET